jgi:hypothetical protein
MKMISDSTKWMYNDYAPERVCVSVPVIIAITLTHYPNNVASLFQTLTNFANMEALKS